MFIFVAWWRSTDKRVSADDYHRRLPQSPYSRWFPVWRDKTGGLVMFLIELVVLLVVIAFAVILLVQELERFVQYAKRSWVTSNMAVLDSIFLWRWMLLTWCLSFLLGGAIMFYFYHSCWVLKCKWCKWFSYVRWLIIQAFEYNLFFTVLIILVAYFCFAITINRLRWLKIWRETMVLFRSIKPGKQTAEYIDVIMSRIALPEFFLLGLGLPIILAFAGIFGVARGFAQFFGGRSLLIALVGVVRWYSPAGREIDLLMRHYDGLLRSGRIKGCSE